MTENEKTNIESIKNAPLFDAGVSIFGEKKQTKQTTPRNHKLIKWNTVCMAEDANEGEGQLKQKTWTLYVMSPKPLVSHILSIPL